MLGLIEQPGGQNRHAIRFPGYKGFRFQIQVIPLGTEYDQHYAEHREEGHSLPKDERDCEETSDRRLVSN